MVRHVLVLIGMVTLLGAPAQAAKDVPAAYVLEVDGGAPPGLEEFAAIEAGAAFVLPAKTSVVFNHIALCQTIRVRGGILIITEKDFAIPGGEIVSTEASECPEKIALESEGVVGGVRLRSFRGEPTVQPAVIRWALPVRPVIFIRGDNADAVTRIKLFHDDRMVIDLPVERDPIIWPRSAPSLAYNTPYLLAVEDLSAATISRTWVRTMAETEERKSEVVFLHVD